MSRGKQIQTFLLNMGDGTTKYVPDSPEIARCVGSPCGSLFVFIDSDRPPIAQILDANTTSIKVSWLLIIVGMQWYKKCFGSPNNCLYFIFLRSALSSRSLV